MTRRELKELAAANISFRRTGTTRSGHVRKNPPKLECRKRVDFTERTVNNVIDKTIRVSNQLSQIANNSDGANDSIPSYTYHPNGNNFNGAESSWARFQSLFQIPQLSRVSDPSWDIDTWLNNSFAC